MSTKEQIKHKGTGEEPSELTPTIYAFIVTDNKSDKWFYFLKKEHAELFKEALKLDETVNPVDYYSIGFVTAWQSEIIDLYRGKQVFNGIDEHFGNLLVRSNLK